MLTLSRVLAASQLSQLQLRTIAPQIQLQLPAVTITKNQGFRLLVVGLFHRLRWLTDEQVQFLITACLECLQDVDVAAYHFHIAFCDGDRVTWTGLTGFYSLVTGELVQTEQPAFESIAYNFWVPMQKLLQEEQGCPPATSGPTPSPTQPLS